MLHMYLSENTVRVMFGRRELSVLNVERSSWHDMPRDCAYDKPNQASFTCMKAVTVYLHVRAILVGKLIFVTVTLQ